LEVKTRSAFKASDWSDGVPDDTLAQTTWGLHVTGLDHMHVAALIGGQRLLTFRVDRDEKLIDYLVAAAEPVWEAVVNGVPPEAHPDSEGVLLDLLNKVYAKREGERPVDRSEAEAWVDQYLDGADLAAKAEEMQTEAKTALVQLLGDGDTAVVDEQAWWTYKRPKGSDKVYTGDLKRLSVERPLLYSILRSRGYISSPIPGPRFALKRTRIEEASPAVSGDLPGLVER
jgi:predicted phage-related endonuclease